SVIRPWRIVVAATGRGPLHSTRRGQHETATAPRGDCRRVLTAPDRVKPGPRAPHPPLPATSVRGVGPPGRPWPVAGGAGGVPDRRRSRVSLCTTSCRSGGRDSAGCYSVAAEPQVQGLHGRVARAFHISPGFSTS